MLNWHLTAVHQLYHEKSFVEVAAAFSTTNQKRNTTAWESKVLAHSAPPSAAISLAPTETRQPSKTRKGVFRNTALFFLKGGWFCFLFLDTRESFLGQTIKLINSHFGWIDYLAWKHLPIPQFPFVNHLWDKGYEMRRCNYGHVDMLMSRILLLAKIKCIIGMLSDQYQRRFIYCCGPTECEKKLTVCIITEGTFIICWFYLCIVALGFARHFKETSAS